MTDAGRSLEERLREVLARVEAEEQYILHTGRASRPGLAQELLAEAVALHCEALAAEAAQRRH